MEYEMKRKQRIFYILSPDYQKTLKVLTASELAELLGIKKRTSRHLSGNESHF